MQKTPSTTTVPFQTAADSSRACRIQLFNTAPPQDSPGRLRIHVLFTNPADTRAALYAAVKMAAELESQVAVIVPQIVPYPLPIDHPPVGLEFASAQIRRLADSVHADHARLQGYIYLCRNPLDTLLQELPPHALVVIGARTGWPFGKSKRLARALRRSGHEVILAQHG